MKLGITLRNMGPQSVPEILVPCARAADAAGLESLWITDHIAIPPDDAEGSGGRYTDPLTTLAYLAGRTQQIQLGTGVLVLPYRRPLPVAKAVATVQELSGGRLLLGVGVGWMEAEFRAVGAERRRRGRDTDAALDLLQRCFAADEVEANGQPFLFKPRPARPPIYVGGHGEHALRRTVRYGDGWLPMGADPEKLAPAAARLAELAKEAGKPVPEIV
ncbi:MAG: TIGR03619 family F420-dependent LLM class oxidoreductase, partial [Myxococcales bacterium]|nr:TIGR03619 family F420-dependent LLM class oxidoreductase [Myxococcales bacterium]